MEPIDNTIRCVEELILKWVPNVNRIPEMRKDLMDLVELVIKESREYVIRFG